MFVIQRCAACRASTLSTHKHCQKRSKIKQTRKNGNYRFPRWCFHFHPTRPPCLPPSLHDTPQAPIVHPDKVDLFPGISRGGGFQLWASGGKGPPLRAPPGDTLPELDATEGRHIIGKVCPVFRREPMVTGYIPGTYTKYNYIFVGSTVPVSYTHLTLPTILLV